MKPPSALVLMALSLLLCACSPEAKAETKEPKVTPTVTRRATTDQDLIAVVNAFFPKFTLGEFAGKSGPSCYAPAYPGQIMADQPCPISQGLKLDVDNLISEGNTEVGALLCKCTGTTNTPPFSSSPKVEGAGGEVNVVVNNTALTLEIILENGNLVVDDLYCQGKVWTSIKSQPTPTC